MKKIPLTQGKFAVVDDDDYAELSRYKWCIQGDGYAVRKPRKSDGAGEKQIRMHRVIAGTPVGMTTDHINGDKLDNRKSNLRMATSAENQHNVQKRKDNISGFKGVSFSRRNGKWRATIAVNGVRHSLGLFSSPEDAAKSYNSSAIKYHGEFARLNVV